MEVWFNTFAQYRHCCTPLLFLAEMTNTIGGTSALTADFNPVEVKLNL